MKYFLKSLLFTCLITLPHLLFSWNYTGHVLVAQIAYDELTPEIKIKADNLAEIVFNQLPLAQQKKLNFQYPNASLFAKVAVLPDVWRKWNLSTILLRFHTVPPLNLILSLNESTASWHFIDIPYPSNKFCKMKDYKNVVWAITNFDTAMLKTKYEGTKALEMVFLEHYVGDIHQPLHTMTNVTESCAGDKGGNETCIKMNKQGHCNKNLHALWDSGFGYLKPHVNIKAIAYKLENIYPSQSFTAKIDKLTFQDWAVESYQYGSNIYNLQELETNKENYYKDGQAIIKSQLTLAGYRLANLLNNSL